MSEIRFVTGLLLLHNVLVRKFSFPYPLLLLAVWSAILLAGDYVVLDTSVRQILANRFATTVGEITKSDVGRGAIRSRGVEIGYHYIVDGVDYIGHRYRYDDRNGALDYVAVTNALPPISKHTVYYDADNPADSVLMPGLDGCDLLLALFAIPLNIVTIAIWVAAIASRRARHPVALAGGVPIFQRDGETRVRLSVFPPWAVGFFAMAAAAFFAAMLVVFAAGFAPSLRLMYAILLLVGVSGGSFFLWAAQQDFFGRCDLRSHYASQTLLVPPAGGRKEPTILPRGEVVAVTMRRRVSNSPSGQHVSYIPAVERLAPGADAQSLELLDWGWQEEKARAFGVWLSRELGVPLKAAEDGSS